MRTWSIFTLAAVATLSFLDTSFRLPGVFVNSMIGLEDELMRTSYDIGSNIR